MTGVGGLEFLLDLAEATMLRGGDGLRLEDGRVVEVVAEPEPLAEIRAADPLALTRVAWHFGNRHLPTEIMPKALRIRRDPVIEAMAEGLGARVIALEAPFNPEGGAYVKAEGGAASPTSTTMITTTATITITSMRRHAHDHDHDDHGDRITTTITPAAIIQSTSMTMGVADDLGSRLPKLPMAADVSVTISRSPPSEAADADAALLPLMLWLSPAFPVGSFAYSQGLEWAVESGDIHDARSLGGWLVDLLTFGAPRADAILFADCFRAAVAEDWPELVGEQTRSPSRSPIPPNVAWRPRLRAPPLSSPLAPHGIANLCVSFPWRSASPIPSAVASAAAGHGLPLEASLQAFILAQIAAAVSAVVRLGPIGQTDGQKIQATLIPRIRALAREASGSSLTDLGSCAFRSDIAAMRHETQYSRLFRS